VRPLRLSVEGFTSFRDRVFLDLSSLDLFAITGPTGAGKSSLIDAIVFALYGQVPRVGDDYKQLISHGADRLSVLFEFGVGDEQYRIARTARRTGPSQQRLERRSAGGYEAVADRVREMRVEVDRILGLDYEGFTRSVVLPQGQFDAFLKGEPKERRKILVALLDLGIYERMQQNANQKAAAARGEADFIRRQLETDYAGATEEALRALRAERERAEAEAARAEAALRALATGASLGQECRAARREMEALARDEAAENRRVEEADATLRGGDERRARLDSELEAVRREREALVLDEERQTALVSARPRVQQLAELVPRLERAEKAASERAAVLAQREAALAGARAAVPGAEAEEARARAEEAKAREAREAAHRAHAAAALRRELRPGEPCPVCAQTVRQVPAGEAPALEAVEQALRAAEAAARQAVATLQERQVEASRLEAAVEGLRREAAQLLEQCREGRATVVGVESELARAGFGKADTADPRGLLGRVDSELARIASAQKALEALEGRRERAEKDRSLLDGEVAAARAKGQDARQRLDALAARRAEAEERLRTARRELLALAGREGWAGLEPLGEGTDEAEVVEGLRSQGQRASQDAAGNLARLSRDTSALEAALLRAAELATRRRALDETASLHRTLSDVLKANELVAWIQEEALRRLAHEGSRHLLKLSQGRYELRLGTGEEEKPQKAEQDFFVVDHANVDSVRSVKTLSGGETFLASLALALALAEGLAQLSVEGRARDALESLFLDEGFGTLDADTLEVVVGALDALHGGQRRVGIVTHVRELAERLPARLEVASAGGTATATVVG
jgi:exonuclease SbcC